MKARNRKTGEIVDIISYHYNVRREDTDCVSYIDSKGNEHPCEQGLNYYWDFDPIEEPPHINWEQRRYELAKIAMQSIVSSGERCNYACSEVKYEDEERHTVPIAIAKLAIACADALIEQLVKDHEES